MQGKLPSKHAPPVLVLGLDENSVTFELPMPPSNNTYKRHRCTGEVNSQGVHVLTAYVTQVGKDFIEIAQQIAHYAGVRVSDQPLMMHIAAYVGGLRIDADNIPKVVSDALEGIAYENDIQIRRSVVDVYRTGEYTGKRRIVVTLTRGDFMRGSL